VRDIVSAFRSGVTGGGSGPQSIPSTEGAGAKTVRSCCSWSGRQRGGGCGCGRARVGKNRPKRFARQLAVGESFDDQSGALGGGAPETAVFRLRRQPCARAGPLSTLWPTRDVQLGAVSGRTAGTARTKGAHPRRLVARRQTPHALRPDGVVSPPGPGFNDNLRLHRDGLRPVRDQPPPRQRAPNQTAVSAKRATSRSPEIILVDPRTGEEVRPARGGMVAMEVADAGDRVLNESVTPFLTRWKGYFT